MPLLYSFLLTALLIELTPGPNMTYLALVSAVKGRRYGLAATAGIALGLAIIGTAAVFGLAAIINTSPILFQALRWGGALYLLWLAAEAWVGSREVSPGRVTPHDASRQHFRHGLITNLLNPKAALFFIAVLPRFTDPAKALLPQSLLLTAIYVGLATAIHLAITMMAGRANRFFADTNRQAIARKIFALSLIGVAIWVLLTSR